MTFWAWLDKRWPSERQWVTIATFVLAGSMLKMAEVHRELWEVELFKTLLTLVVGSAIVNMIIAFHFAANKNDERQADGHDKTLDTIAAVANASSGTVSDDGAIRDGDHVTVEKRHG